MRNLNLIIGAIVTCLSVNLIMNGIIWLGIFNAVLGMLNFYIYFIGEKDDG